MCDSAITLARVIASRLSIEAGKTLPPKCARHNIFNAIVCPGTHKGIADRNGTEHGFSRGEPRPRHVGSRALLGEEGRREGLARAGFSVIRPPTIYIRVIFFYSLPTSDIYIYGYNIYIAARDPSVSWPIRGRGSANSGGGGRMGGKKKRPRTVGIKRICLEYYLEDR